MNFKDYSNKPKQSKRMTPEMKNMVMNFLADYNGKSQDEIWDAVLETASRNRANGTLSDADIDNFSSMLAPMLNAEQKIRLNEIVKKLKQQKLN